MKRIVASLLVLCLSFVLCACEDDLDRRLHEVERFTDQAVKDANRLLDEYNQLQEEFDEYSEMIDRLD